MESVDWTFQTEVVEDRILEWLWRLAAPILLSVGTLGNVLGLVVLMVTPTFRGRRGGAVGFALSALCFVDIGVLMTSLVRRCVLHWTGFDITATSSLACRAHFFLVHFVFTACEGLRTNRLSFMTISIGFLSNILILHNIILFIIFSVTFSSLFLPCPLLHDSYFLLRNISLSVALSAASLSTSSANFHRRRSPFCRQTVPSSCGVRYQRRACLDVDAWRSSGRRLPPPSVPSIFTFSGQHNTSRHHLR